MTKAAASPSLLFALLPLFALIALLALYVFCFGDGTTSGPNPIGLLFAAASAAVLARSCPCSWPP